jgi:DNA-binding Lrp family transcriptional regulator
LTNEHFAMMVFRIVEWLHERRPEDVPLFLLRLEHVPQKQMATQLGLTREAVAKRIQRMNEAILGHKDELGLDDLMDGLLSGGEAA